MSVITISRDFGSEGDYVAQTIAQTLGYHFVDKEFFSKILSEYGLIEFDREYDVLPGFWEKFDVERTRNRDDVVKMLNKVVSAVAQHGNVVILGRSGFEILREFSDIIHVRLQAPLAIRIARVMSELNIPIEKAEEIVNQNDKVHMAFVEEYYKIPWDQVHAFDLVINTGKISSDLAVTWIVNAVKELNAAPESNKPRTSSIEVDPVLKSTVSDALKCNIAHGETNKVYG
jgi:cytidylate kinase